MRSCTKAVMKQNHLFLFLIANQQDNQPDISSQVPTDGLLRRVAAKISKDDWHLLANKLGFTASAIDEFEKNDARTPEDKVIISLSFSVWRSCSFRWFPLQL